ALLTLGVLTAAPGRRTGRTGAYGEGSTRG
ncbi:lysoplasmalogenase, partial [Streptomyces griseus]|nr:lysoplasmalogenase [Streptomyces griseus]